MRRLLTIAALAGAGLSALATPALAYQVTATFGRPGSGPGEFGPPRGDYRSFRLLTSPGGIALAGNTVLVADPLNSRIQRFTRSGRYVGGFGRKGVRPGLFLSPQGLVAHAGNVFVAMNGNDRVDVFSTGGRWRRMFQVRFNVRRTFAMTRGGGTGQLHNPYGIARAPSGMFYVADLANSRVNRYNARGVSRGQIGGFGKAPGQFLAPYGVAADGAGNVWVADRDLNRVQKFTPSGQLLGAVGETGSEPGEFLSPQGLATDRNGNVYVADTYNQRVQKLAPDGRVLAVFGQGVLKQPLYVTVDADCAVYVADYRRVVKFADSAGC